MEISKIETDLYMYDVSAYLSAGTVNEILKVSITLNISKQAHCRYLCKIQYVLKYPHILFQYITCFSK